MVDTVLETNSVGDFLYRKKTPRNEILPEILAHCRINWAQFLDLSLAWKSGGGGWGLMKIPAHASEEDPCISEY